MNNSYGKQLILDLYGCDVKKFTRIHIEQYLKDLCELIDMTRADLHFWDYDDEEEKAAAPIHLCGTSAVQFITTSTIVIHTLDKVGECYIDLFSCKQFNPKEAASFTEKFFKSSFSESTVITRGRRSKCNN